MVSVNQGPGSSSKIGGRAWLARAILVVAGASLVIGILVGHYQSHAADPWRARLVRGEPIEVRFLCGVKGVADCKTTVRITYKRQDSKWCASLQPDDRRQVLEQSWCNADPEHGTISIFGVVHSFDRYGFLRLDDHLVGQMRPG
jgi:hypothetical protein